MATEADLLDVGYNTAKRLYNYARWQIFHILWRSRLYPLSDSAPHWYRFSYPTRVWKEALDSHNRPTSEFLRYYIRAIWRWFVHKLREAWSDAIRAVEATIRTLLGSLAYNFPTFHAWLVFVYEKMGAAVAIWSWNLADGINRLYEWVPYGLREGIQSWLDIFQYWYGRAKEWVIVQYGFALARAIDAWNWVIDVGDSLSAWYDATKAWVLDWAQNAAERVRGVLGSAWAWLVSFYNDPGGTVLGLLGPAWTALVSWYEGPLTFYYNLWGSYATMLGDFLGDPLGWLYDRIEVEIVRRW